MTSREHRISISLSVKMKNILSALAKRDNVSESVKAMELIELGILTDEDRAFERLAASRETKNAQFISHEEVWNVRPIAKRIKQ